MSVHIKAAGFRKSLAPQKRKLSPIKKAATPHSQLLSPDSNTSAPPSLPLPSNTSRNSQVQTGKLKGSKKSSPRSKNAKNIKKCDLCEEHVITLWCNACTRYLCSSCSKAHCRVSACREGHLVTLEAMYTRQAHEIQRAQSKVQSTQHRLEEQFKEHSKQFQAQQKKNQAALDAAYASLQYRMDQHFKAQSKRLQEIANRYTAETKAKHQQDMKSLEQHLQRLAQVQAKSVDALPKPAGTDNPVLDQVNRDIQRMGQEPGPVIQPLIMVNEETNHEAFSERNAATVELVQSSTKKTKAPAYSMLLDRTLGVSTSAGLPSSVQSLLHVGDRLWCLMYDKLHVLSIKENMQPVAIKKDLRGARGMTLTQHKHVIVATLDTGLLEFSPKGKMLQCIDEGRYHDVSFSKDTLYGVSKNKNNSVVVQPFTQRQNQWVKSPQIITEQILQRGHMTMVVQDESIFVSSTGQDCLFRLGMSGFTQAQLQLGTDPMHNTAIQGVDETGLLLVLDSRAIRLMVLDPSNDQWKEVELPAFAAQPTAATLGPQGVLYVATADSVTNTYRLFTCQ